MVRATAASHLVISDAADRDLERRVTSFLADRHLPGLRRVNVSAHKGIVTLRGRVQSFYEKQLCQLSCSRVAGVLEIVDAVDVA